MTRNEERQMIEIISKVNEITNLCAGLKSENDSLKRENDFLREMLLKNQSEYKITRTLQRIADGYYDNGEKRNT